jgi:hypothetical protein
MKSTLGYLALGSALVAISTLTAAEEFADCRALADAEERLACYDRLATPPSADPAAGTEGEPAVVEAPQPADPLPQKVTEESAPVRPAAATPTRPGASADAGTDIPLSDEIGRETLKQGQQAERELAARGRLERCQKSRSGKYVFYFDNGQIWKQADSKRLPWKDCTFEVTIGKDFFGYQMTRDDDQRSVRISRVK